MSAILFIVGIKRLSHPATARQGNMLASIGMLIAIVATLLDREIVDYWQIAVGWRLVARSALSLRGR